MALVSVLTVAAYDEYAEHHCRRAGLGLVGRGRTRPNKRWQSCQWRHGTGGTAWGGDHALSGAAVYLGLGSGKQCLQ
jgi:hypothetical protein